MDQQTLFDTGAAPRTKLGGRYISDHEWACVQAGLAAFNAQAGSKLGALRGDGRLSDAGTRIGMRARQWPALTTDDFRDVVRRGFERPWWKGRPSVGVIFNPGIFEGLIGQGERGPTEDDFDAYLRSLEAEPVIEATAVEVR
jgi:hypothetical protein